MAGQKAGARAPRKRKTAPVAPAGLSAEEQEAVKRLEATKNGQNGEQPTEVQLTPAQQFERDLQALCNRFVHQIGAIPIAKMLGIAHVDTLAFYSEQIAVQARDQAVQISLTKAGRFRPQPSRKNAATKKRRKSR